MNRKAILTMWMMTLCCNVLFLSLFWLIAQVAITPAHNLLVQYAETGAVLPILTDVAIQIRTPSIIVPLAWAIFTVFMGIRIRDRAEIRRSELLSLHTSMSLCLGLLVLFFFGLAGILPALKIGAVIG